MNFVNSFNHLVEVLIETYWNVNSLTAVGSSSRERVLIETYWNVNTLEDVIEQTGTTVLIETYWNVNAVIKSATI